MSTLILMPYVRSELAENYKMMNLGNTQQIQIHMLKLEQY